MLLSSKKEPFDDPEYLFEIKWDGYRGMATVENGKANLNSRKDFHFKQFSRITDELATLPDCILDGEIVVLTEEGKADFEALQRYNDSIKNRLFYCVYDLLWLNGTSYINLPLIKRKEALNKLVQGLRCIRYTDHIIGRGKDFYKAAEAANIEGIVAKKISSKYRPGLRSKDWIKIKFRKTTTAYICGVTNEVTEFAPYGSLILGNYDSTGTLRGIGTSTAGFSKATVQTLFEQLKGKVVADSPLKYTASKQEVLWVKPEVQCEVSYQEITSKGYLRHSFLQRLL